MAVRNEEILNYLSGNLDTYLKILKDMVAINSDTKNVEGIENLSNLTASIFKELGFTPEFVPNANPFYGNHLILKRPGESDSSLALVSHLDTVYSVQDEIRDNFHFRIHGDKVYGPGTCDIKGGTLVCYMMLDALSKLAP